MKPVTYIRTARKALKALPTALQVRIEAKLADYAATGAGDVVKMQGQAGARLRVGDYRVVFVETAEAIEVRAVGDRRDIYR